MVLVMNQEPDTLAEPLETIQKPSMLQWIDLESLDPELYYNFSA